MQAAEGIGYALDTILSVNRDNSMNGQLIRRWMPRLHSDIQVQTGSL